MNDMKKWENISDYLFFQEGPGVRNHQYTTDGVKLLNVANLVNGRVDLSTSERYISSDEAYGKYKHFLADEGDLIIASSGIKVDYFDKKMGFIRKEHLPICMNTSTIRFKSIDKSKLDINYFMYYLKSQLFKDQLSKQITGSAQLNFGPSHLKKMEFPIVDIEEQSSINSVLGNIQSQIRLKEEQLTEYDQLIKSRFVEMFGDIFTNEKRYRIGAFNDFVTQMNIGPFGSALKNDYFVSKDDGYCMVYEQKHAIRKNIDVDRRYVDLKKYNELSRFEVGPGDLIVSCRGTIGECHILPNDAPRGIIHPSLMMIKPKGSVNGKFLLHLLERILERQLDNGSGVKMAIQAKELAKVKTIVPDRHLQDEYILFVEQVDKLKFEVQKSLNETQMLFDSLMQEYFG